MPISISLIYNFQHFTARAFWVTWDGNFIFALSPAAADSSLANFIRQESCYIRRARLLYVRRPTITGRLCLAYTAAGWISQSPSRIVSFSKSNI